MTPTTWTGIAPIDFVANSVVNLFNLLSFNTGLSYWTTVALTVFVAWPIASLAVYQTCFNTKKTNAPGCNA
jgi:hypothetical protein